MGKKTSQLGECTANCLKYVWLETVKSCATENNQWGRHNMVKLSMVIGRSQIIG